MAYKGKMKGKEDKGFKGKTPGKTASEGKSGQNAEKGKGPTPASVPAPTPADFCLLI